MKLEQDGQAVQRVQPSACGCGSACRRRVQCSLFTRCSPTKHSQHAHNTPPGHPQRIPSTQDIHKTLPVHPQNTSSTPTEHSHYIHNTPPGHPQHCHCASTPTQHSQPVHPRKTSTTPTQHSQPVHPQKTPSTPIPTAYLQHTCSTVTFSTPSSTPTTYSKYTHNIPSTHTSPVHVQPSKDVPGSYLQRSHKHPNSLHTALIRHYEPCDYWHRIISCQKTGTKPKRRFTSSMSGSLSATALLTTLLESLKWECSYLSGG